MERILLCSKKTGLHDDVLRILYLHMDPLLPLPRLRMISVTGFSLGTNSPEFSTNFNLLLFVAFHLFTLSFHRFFIMFSVLFLLIKLLLDLR